MPVSRNGEVITRLEQGFIIIFSMMAQQITRCLQPGGADR